VYFHGDDSEHECAPSPFKNSNLNIVNQRISHSFHTIALGNNSSRFLIPFLLAWSSDLRCHWQCLTIRRLLLSILPSQKPETVRPTNYRCYDPTAQRWYSIECLTDPFFQFLALSSGMPKRISASNNCSKFARSLALEVIHRIAESSSSRNRRILYTSDVPADHYMLFRCSNANQKCATASSKLGRMVCLDSE